MFYDKHLFSFYRTICGFLNYYCEGINYIVYTPETMQINKIVFVYLRVSYLRELSKQLNTLYN